MAVNDHDWAVVISVSDYEGATATPPWITKLKGPDNDAAAIAAWLTAPEGGGLPVDHVLQVPSPFPASAITLRPCDRPAETRADAAQGQLLIMFAAGFNYTAVENELEGEKMQS